MKMNMEKMNRNMLITLTRKEMVMKMEKMNMPPRPYKWRVLLPLLQGHCEVGDVLSFCHEEYGLWTCHDMLLINLSLPPVHERDGHEGHEDHDGADADGGVLGRGLAQTGCDEQVGRVVEDRVDPRQLRQIEMMK